MLQRVEIAPQDVIDAIKSLEIKERIRYDWIVGWFPENTMLEWAKKSLSTNDPKSNADAVTWAKRSVCARIDRFIELCLLGEIAKRKNYPEKIRLLREVKIDFPDVVYEFVIKPRNELEHLYRQIGHSEAKHATEIAILIIAATDKYLNGDVSERLCSCIVVNWNLLYHYQSGTQKFLEFYDFTEETMVFVDVFTDPIEVKVIDPVNKEVRFTELKNFNREELLEFSILLNQWQIDNGERRETQYPLEFFQAAKAKLCF